MDSGNLTKKKISNLKSQISNESGQTLLELIIVITVAAMVVGALTFATISSLRNAQFSKNQTQSTKLAQAGLETIRSIRNKDGAVVFAYSGGTTTKFSDLWNIPGGMSSSCNPCYFKLDPSNLSLNGVTSATFEPLSDNLERQVQIWDKVSTASVEKMISVIVRWSDFSGWHQSQLTSILRKI